MFKSSAGDKIFDSANSILLIFIAATMIFPFIYIFAVSFSSLSDFLENDLLLWPKEWVTDAYEYILGSDQFIRSLFVTIYITVIGTFINLFFTSTMAYALTRKIHGQRMILFLVLFTMLFSAGMIPTYMIVKATGLLNTLWALIIPVAISPFNLIIMRQFFQGIPEELTEAAIIDGANDLQIFTKIILPLSKPALAAFGLFYAVSHWNSYFTGVLYLSDPAKWPIQVILRQIVIVNEPNAALGAHEMMESLPPPETVQMAAILLATIPILIVYPFLQKHFAKGVMLGSVKG
ncbi:MULTISPECIES: carbohydrate ABC transporter permease [Bacillus]|uniref:ABC transporter permease n=1 Tax=Bacillus infantis NRRL B-14911 TaxID=1367477 RepID=U5LIA5_9BACI|nr:MULTISPECIES: carbohydrate ABC transporter permease [Bacillus]AGX06357.1 ABC transporter permease [Bacillus infantis NRRL B-14911]EAR68716.1 transmembrane lipoprotein [Bacillus sp. NRRL B-14911]MCA1033610.1 carbohydrate ABC transporter permease [Bacillus infantis]